MANAFYAAFGACKRRGLTSAYCYREVKKNLGKTSRKKSRRKAGRRVTLRGARVARKGSTCRRMTKVWSPALGKRVKRCTGGYKGGRKRRGE